MSYSYNRVHGIAVVRDAQGNAICTCSDPDMAARVCESMAVLDVIEGEHEAILFDDQAAIKEISIDEVAMDIQTAIATSGHET